MIRSLLKGFLLNSLGLFLLKITGVILSIVVARNIGLLELGHYSSAVSGIILFGNSVAIALSLTTASFYVKSKNKNNDIDSLNLYLMGCIAVLCYFIIFSIFFYLFKDVLFNDYAEYFPLLIFSVLFYSPVFGILNASQKYTTFGVYAFFGSLFFAICTFICIKYQMLTVSVALILYVLPYIVIGGVIHYKIIKTLGGATLVFGKIKSVVSEDLLSYFKQNFFLAISSAAVPFALWFAYNQVEIGVNTQENVALFASSMQWSFVFSQISVVIGGVLVSKLSNSDKGITALNQYSAWFPVSLMACFVIAFPEIHIFVFGSEFQKNIISPVLTIVLISTVFNALKSALQRNMVAKNLTWLSTLGNSIWLFLFIIPIIIFPIENVSQFSWIYLLSNLITFVIMSPVYLKYQIINFANYKNFASLSLFILIGILSIVSFLNWDLEMRFILWAGINVLVLFTFGSLISKARSNGFEKM